MIDPSHAPSTHTALAPNAGRNPALPGNTPSPRSRQAEPGRVDFAATRSPAEPMKLDHEPAHITFRPVNAFQNPIAEVNSNSKKQGS